MFLTRVHLGGHGPRSLFHFTGGQGTQKIQRACALRLSLDDWRRDGFASFHRRCLLPRLLLAVQRSSIPSSHQNSITHESDSSDYLEASTFRRSCTRVCAYICRSFPTSIHTDDECTALRACGRISHTRDIDSGCISPPCTTCTGLAWVRACWGADNPPLPL